MTGTRLLADIGGTNARFARCDEAGAIVAKRSYLVAEADFPATLARYLAETVDFGMPAAAALAAAGPVQNGSVRLTNADWTVSSVAVTALAGDIPVRVFNDLEAVALALPYLSDRDLRVLAGPSSDRLAGERMLAVNVGTGFGAASVARAGGGWLAAPSEAGHMSFGATDADELVMLAGEPGFMIEHVLSGPGLLTLYRRRSATLAMSGKAGTAEQVLARVSSDQAAADTLHYFTVWLARAARDLVLASASWGGVFLVGSVVQSWAELASLDLFRQHFVGTGKLAQLLAETPVALVLHEDPALLGLARARLP